MSEKSIVDFIEEWQTGFFLLIGTVLVGVVTGVAAGSLAGASGAFFGIIGGAILAFLAFSYALYGR